jgi:kynurenine 3-monooxygenase
MMRNQPMEFSQHFSQMKYKELYIPPTAEAAQYALPPQRNNDASSAATNSVPASGRGAEALHLWPRQDFLLLAMPNKDRSFSATLFAPEHIFQMITSPEEVRDFFDKNFPDASAVMPTLVQPTCHAPTYKPTLANTRVRCVFCCICLVYCTL